MLIADVGIKSVAISKAVTTVDNFIFFVKVEWFIFIISLLLVLLSPLLLLLSSIFCLLLLLLSKTFGTAANALDICEQYLTIL